VDLNHLKHDLPLNKQLEELYLSTKESISYMDDTCNKEYNTISYKKQQRLVNANPKQAHKDILKDKNTASSRPSSLTGPRSQHH